MEYSWRFGETTEGFLWSENMPHERSRRKETDACKRDGRGRAAVAAMLLALVSSYFAGEVISFEGGAVGTGNGSPDRYDDAISVMSPSVMGEGKSEEVWASEREARIEELATAYIEEYMSENYGEREP